jgi:hypothetical protein
LKVLLAFSWTNHREAIFFAEVVADEPSDFVFLFDCVRGSFLFFESILKVLLWTDGVELRILKLKSEITNNPQETWKVLTDCIRINVFGFLATNCQLFG